MKILMVNKFYYIKGGSETYYFSLKKLLEKKGNSVIDFSMQSDENFASPFSKYFVGHIDYGGEESLKGKIISGMKIIYSFEAKKKFESLVRNEQPDLIHMHIFQHQISPSILDIIKKYNIPTVYTAHDLKMLCLNYKMMHHGKICEDCKGGHYFHCALNKCVKGSFSKSCINVIEGYLHKWRKSYDAIDFIITPSVFYKKKFEEFGIDPAKVVHIPNFLITKTPIVNKTNDSMQYYLYFGRLSEEKGIMTLIRACENIDATLYIAGTGPLKSEIEEYIRNKNLNNIKMLGFVSGQEKYDLIANAKAVILPSEWYENGPYSAIEALQLGRPIIGANIGGIPEVIDHNGFSFISGNTMSLKNAILMMEKCSEQQCSAMQKESVRLFEQCNTEEQHYQKLIEVYKRAKERKLPKYSI